VVTSPSQAQVAPQAGIDREAVVDSAAVLNEVGLLPGGKVPACILDRLVKHIQRERITCCKSWSKRAGPRDHILSVIIVAELIGVDMFPVEFRACLNGMATLGSAEDVAKILVLFL
jgi:hypothetical protein